VAIYHLSVKPVSRAGGRSATAAAAYRSGELVHDHTSGEVFDYTRKRGVEYTEIVLPTEAARRDINWARDREALWNAAEGAENRSNSRVAREYELALPHELDRGQRQSLVQAFSQQLADRYGVAVDIAIHAPHRNGDERNHHAHLLTTTRVIEGSGLGDKAQIEWSDTNRRKAGLGPAKAEITAVREQWEKLVNEQFQTHQIDARIDHRSLEAQGIAREPQSHLGPAVNGMERRGIETEVGKRIGLEVASQRLEQAAAQGRAEREQSQVQTSIVQVSSDLEGAKRERDLMLLRQQQMAQQPPTLEQIRAQARENWLAMRAEQQAKGHEKSAEPSTEKSADAAPTMSLEEIQQQARANWLAYRAMTPEQRQARDQELQKDRGQAQGPERSQGRDGPEID
jgi:ATP-dependent exoDNAse (exonuclease V) alpha subunit